MTEAKSSDSMLFYVAQFGKIRYFAKNDIPVSTAIWDPKWYHDFRGQSYCFLDKRGVMNGIREESLNFHVGLNEPEGCRGRANCPYLAKYPGCSFLKRYGAYLETVDFDGYLLPELRRTAEDVRKANGFFGEPHIVLMVHESADNPCSERVALRKLFAEHGIDLKEWEIDEKDTGHGGEGSEDPGEVPGSVRVGQGENQVRLFG